MTLDLSDQEAAVLLKVLEVCLGDLRVEIRHTEGSDYRAALHGDEDVMRGLIEKLKG